MRQAASELGLDIDGIYRRDLLAVSVIFKAEDQESWVYSDWKKDWDYTLIYRTIRNLAWTLNLERSIVASAGA